MYARKLIPLGVCCLANVLVLGAAGQLPFEALTAAAVHHVYHIVLPTAAFVIFVIYVAIDVRRRGWPTFSWRLAAGP
jgi:hypothetical protein